MNILYPLLFKAVEGLPVTLKVAGYGHWYAREKHGSRLHHPRGPARVAAEVGGVEPDVPLVARAQGERLPLYGMPFAGKDNIDVEGQPMKTLNAGEAFIIPPGMASSILGVGLLFVPVQLAFSTERVPAVTLSSRTCGMPPNGSRRASFR